MSTATELNRIIQAKADLKTAIEAKGVTVPSATTIDGYATLVGQISGGGGGGSQDMIDLIERDITSIDLSNTGITSIGSYSFYGCTSLTNITIPSSVQNILDNGFDGCTSLASITIPSSVRHIGAYVFFSCTSLASVTIEGETVTVLNQGLFYNCSGLTSFTIPSSVTNISDSAFRDSGLTSITIPSSVTNIGARCFQGCSNLSSVTVEATTPPTLANTSAFLQNASGRKIYVPAASVEDYKAANNWSTYAADIEAIPST